MGLMAWALLANPTVLQGGGGDRESKQGYRTKDIANWRAEWFDQHHPQFKAMMDNYLDITQGCLQLADVLNTSGK